MLPADAPRATGARSVTGHAMLRVGELPELLDVHVQQSSRGTATHSGHRRLLGDRPGRLQIGYLARKAVRAAGALLQTRQRRPILRRRLAPSRHPPADGRGRNVRPVRGPRERLARLNRMTSNVPVAKRGESGSPTASPQSAAGGDRAARQAKAPNWRGTTPPATLRLAMAPLRRAERVRPRPSYDDGRTMLPNVSTTAMSDGCATSSPIREHMRVGLGNYSAA